VLRIGAFPSALATVVPRPVAAVLAARPGLEVQLSEGPLDELVAGACAGELHVAVCFQDASQPRREHPGTRRRDLPEDPMLLALPPCHRLARRRRVRLAEPAGDPWTAPSRDGFVVRACRDAGFEPRLGIVTGDPLTIRAVVSAGLAVSLTPRLVAGQLAGVRIVSVDGDTPRRTIYALLPDAGARETDRALLEELERAL
jgi:DNA-binding transcriptional LysR family regulator